MRVEKNADLAALRESLLVCGEMYLSDDLDTQRVAVFSALHNVADYLEKNDFPDIVLLTITRPALALAERHTKNALDQMFTQRPREGRPKETNDKHIRTAFLAALANAWLQIHHDDDRLQSAKLAEAARKMRGPWFKETSGAALKTAREIVSREAKDHIVVETFEGFSSLIDEISATIGLRQTFKFMVDLLNEEPIMNAMGILQTIPISPPEEE